MKIHTLLLSLLLVFFSMTAYASKNCAIKGEASHWQIDYCMYLAESDDEIAAMSCDEQNTRHKFTSSCSKKYFYKTKICAIAIRDGHRKGAINTCVADPEFRGSVVRDKGIIGKTADD